MKKYLESLLLVILWLLVFAVFATPVVIPMVACLIFKASPWLFLLLVLYIPIIALFVMWADES